MKPFLLLLSLFFLLGCQNNANKEYAPDLTDATSVTGLTGDSIKLVKTAGIRFKVSNVERSLRNVSVMVQQLGGRIYNHTFQSIEDNRKEMQVSDDSLLVISTLSPQADITVRLPAENLEAFLFGVADLGYYTVNNNLKLDDRSLLYLQNALKQKARTDALTKGTTLKPTIAGQQQAIAIKDEAVDQFIANKTIDAEATYSTVNLSLFQNAVVKKETIANYVVADYELPFGLRLSNSLRAGWDAFLTFLLAVLHLWMFVLLSLFAFLFYKLYQSKKKLPAYYKSLNK